MNDIATFFRESRVARFFIPVGIILIVFSIFLFGAVNHNKNYVKTDAVVSKTELVEDAYTDENGNRVEATYKVYVKYTVSGKEYETELGEISGYKENDKMQIVYNPENPNEISQPATIILPIAILICGIASLIGGIISAVRAVKKQKAMKEQEKGWKKSE